MSMFWFQRQNTAFGLQVEQQQGPATRVIKIGQRRIRDIIDHLTVVCSVTWSNGSEAGADFALI